MTEVDPQIRELEALAKSANVKMTAVLTDVGVAPTTWWRMRKGLVEPKIGTLRKVQDALARHLSERDAA